MTKAGPEYIVKSLWPLCRPIDDLILDDANARKHSERNVAAIKSSLRRFKQRIPIVVQKDNMVVRAGNGRVVAARELGWEQIACVLVAESDVEAVSFAIADNRSAELAEWDFPELARWLDELMKQGIELPEIGWEEHEYGPLLEADWNPPPSQSNPTDTSGHVSVSFSPEEWEEVGPAITVARRDRGAKNDAQALVIICSEFTP